MLGYNITVKVNSYGIIQFLLKEEHRMHNGSRYWAHSRVELKNGKKLFVEESNVRKSDISSYKHHFLF